MNLLNDLFKKTKINPKKLKLGKVHPSFLQAIKQAPSLRVGDYEGVFKVVQSWFNGKLFKYSMLDRLNQRGGKLSLHSDKLYFTGKYKSCDLSYNSSVCYGLACKLIYLLNICYPWFDVSLVEVKSWKNTGSNHYYVFFPTLGFFKNNQKVSTNNFTGADIQPNTNYQYRGQFFALDPCAGIITNTGLSDYSLGDDKTSMQLGAKYHVFCDSEIMTPGGAGSTHFIYSQTCFVGRVVRLGVMNNNPGKLSWVLVHDHVETNYDFYDPEFLHRISDIYPDAWKDFNQLIKRGYTILK